LTQPRLNAPIISNEVRDPEDRPHDRKHQTSQTNLAEGIVVLPNAVHGEGNNALWCKGGFSGIARGTLHRWNDIGHGVNYPAQVRAK
jgi:hypothetical protein